MTAPTIAWGKLYLFGMPDGSSIYGREFELLPAGTMFAANVILHGLIGAEAIIADDNTARIRADAKLRMMAVRGTSAHEIEAYRSDVLEAYRVRQLQDAQT